MRNLIALCFMLMCLQGYAGSTNVQTIYLPPFMTYSAASYVPSEKNVAYLNQIKSELAPVRIVGFDLSDQASNSLLCRLSYPIYAPGKKTFASALADAMAFDLHAAGLYDHEKGNPIHGRLDGIDFNSFGTGKWTIEATFSFSENYYLKVKSESTFPVSGNAISACQEVSRSFKMAMQEFLYGLYTDPGFKKLAGKERSIIPDPLHSKEGRLPTND